MAQLYLTNKKMIRNMEVFEVDLRTSYEVIREVNRKMHEMGFQPDSAYLRNLAGTDFDLLVTLPEAEILDDRVLPLYYQLAEIEEFYKTDYYQIHISLCGLTPDFAEENVFADGFSLKYNLAD